MSYEALPGNELAAVVTYLEMRERPEIAPPSSTLDLLRLTNPTAERYRALFRLVGSPWLWFSRLTLDEDELEAIIQHQQVELFAVQDGNSRDMVFSPEEQIAHVSNQLTLQPGDIFSTGTPEGFGAQSNAFLTLGDIVEAEIEGLGAQRNRLVARH